MEDGGGPAGFEGGSERFERGEVGRVEGPLRLVGELALYDVERRDGGLGVARDERLDQRRPQESLSCSLDGLSAVLVSILYHVRLTSDNQVRF